jgi:hypothetical protein
VTTGQVDPQVWVAAGRAGIPYHDPGDGSRQATRCGRWYGLDQGKALRGGLIALSQATTWYDARPCMVCFPVLPEKR